MITTLTEPVSDDDIETTGGPGGPSQMGSATPTAATAVTLMAPTAARATATGLT